MPLGPRNTQHRYTARPLRALCGLRPSGWLGPSRPFHTAHLQARQLSAHPTLSAPQPTRRLLYILDKSLIKVIKMSNTSKVVKAKLKGGGLLRMEVTSVDEARFIADKLVWQRFEVNEVSWTGPFGVNMLYTIANHFEYVRMVTITPLPVQINPWTITRGKPYWKQVWRKHVEALAIEPFAGCTAANLECFRMLARRKVSMRFVERVGYPMSVSGA